ncbi:hypothetical protein EVG20_g3250 [Dentipellis fragilis]|uniref:CUE domain-containing protein n=1 Tax=Dentipellis fragilis TaxID=205917 RepID=A0A4Y9Z4Z3_9AGAM|nr:hypothetical protein EVG20_g3250 [Dentipellis fragilis]
MDAAQLALSQPWSTPIVALIGLLSGALYRSDLVGLKTYRLPPWFVRASSRILLPLVGTTRGPRRTNRALPENRVVVDEGEVVTTARPSRQTAAATAAGAAGGPGSTSVMREWVNELTGRAERASTGLRVPSEAEITQLMAMFPDVQRDVVVAALQRSSNIEGAVETLLSAQ